MQNNNNNNKQTNKQKIEKWQHCKKWQKWPFGRPLVRQNDEKSPILGLQFKFPKTHETQIGSLPETNMFELQKCFLNIVQKRLLENESEIAIFFYFSRRSCDLVVGKLLLLKNEYPCTIHHSHKKSKVSASWFLTRPINSLRYFCYICGLFRAPFRFVTFKLC